MNTYRIKKKDLKNKEVLAEGYKIFEKGFKALNYNYADENGNIKGSFHKVDGDIEECRWGLHFSKNPFHCFNFYECVQWNEFAKVRAYEKIIDSEDNQKSVAQVLEIVETYTFVEFINVLKEYNKQKYMSNGINWSDEVYNSDGVNCSDGINNSDGINDSKGVNCSDGINDSKGINGSDGINESKGINGGDGVYNSDGVNCSYGISNSDGINDSQGVNCSDGINNSDGINDSKGVNCSDGINNSKGINRSHGINDSQGVNCSYGINNSDGVYNSDGVNCSYGIDCSKGINRSYGISNSYGIVKSEGVSKSIFCYDFSGKLALFNKQITEKRFIEISDKIRKYGWIPNFNNAFELKEKERKWFNVNIPGICSIDNKTAWSTMPIEMKEYIQSLEEYDEEIFNKITGDLDSE